jgi:hypothetical protein
MKNKLVISTILISIGAFSIFFINFIIKFQEKIGTAGCYSITQRKHKILIVGISFILIGIYVIFDYIKSK